MKFSKSTMMHKCLLDLIIPPQAQQHIVIFEIWDQNMLNFQKKISTVLLKSASIKRLRENSLFCKKKFNSE